MVATLGSLSPAAAANFTHVSLETTQGEIVIALERRAAPLTTRNFLAYVNKGHYAGTVFHRVIPEFMAQAGGYDESFHERPTDDPIPNESGNGLHNEYGTVAMARGDDPHSARAQFYINLDENRHLNPRHGRWGYAVFGRVVDGMEVVERIAQLPTAPRGPFASDVPVQTVKIRRAVPLEDWQPKEVPESE
jgi:cyclophilin family peptidyl-prolyl cis-trans isomerase